MIYIYFLISFVFTWKLGEGTSDVKYLASKIIAVIFYACICMVIFPLGMGKLLYKIYEKNN